MRRLTRWAVPVFLLAFATTLAELCWWTTFNLRNVRASCAAHERALARDAALATRLVGSGAASVEALAGVFDQLTFLPDGQAVPKAQALQAVRGRARAHTRMFVAEGCFFAATMVAGLLLIVRALRHEMGLVRQEQNFLAAVTHELKSPLAAIRLWAETLGRRAYAPEEQRRYLGFILGDIERLDNLVSNVLAAARLQHTAPPRARAQAAKVPALDLAAESAELVTQLTPHAQAKQVTLTYLRPEACWAHVAPEAWALVLRNLLDNAIKYSPKASTVDIRLRAGEQNHTLEVVDCGTGLAARELTRIFAKFYRVGNEMVRGSQGTGLGLFLVRRVLAHHGGTVRAESAGLGRGARFVVDVPAAPPPAGKGVRLG